MKTMTCKQLADSWEEMAKLSQDHGTEMFAKKDVPHIEAMNNMMKMMSDPNAMQKWMDEKRKEFDSLPEDK